ncbi:transcription cofactor vestigial-like protein 2 isoform X2 [Ornithodoros turicata]|uniref:transcription cofactor vestigial-like protein 2 isoform X2 n=1 Tax=Ornithodoros turicata TaxID=34597 RepID=UPI00313A0AC9
MSCTEVMYQPYSPYFPYQRPATVTSCPGSASISQAACLDYKRFVNSKMQDVLSTSSSSSPPVHAAPPPPLQQSLPHQTHQHQHPSGRSSSSCAVASASSSPVSRVAPEESNGAKVSSPITGASGSSADAQYLSANCVVFTYYSGDISSVVDEHFSRALSQPSSYDSARKGLTVKDTPPMSQRNFPASFWNCNQPASSASSVAAMGSMATPHPADLYPSDPYHHGAAGAALHASLQNDPWHYALTAPQGAPYRSSAMHELAYSAAGGPNRFNPHQYGSLLLQPSVRSSRLNPVSATCAAMEKASDSWTGARYHHDQITGNIGHLDGNYGTPAYGTMGTAMTGLEGQVQDAGKDLYWF